jgi:hypothetical protein
MWELGVGKLFYGRILFGFPNGIRPKKFAWRRTLLIAQWITNDHQGAAQLTPSSNVMRFVKW